MRKIIQITTGATDTDNVLFALCDDGTLWKFKFLSSTGKCEWIVLDTRQVIEPSLPIKLSDDSIKP